MSNGRVREYRLRESFIQFQGNYIYVTMQSPNIEIKTIYESQISDWFTRKVKESDRSGFYQAVLDGETEKFVGYIKKLPL